MTGGDWPIARLSCIHRIALAPLVRWLTSPSGMKSHPAIEIWAIASPNISSPSSISASVTVSGGAIRCASRLRTRPCAASRPCYPSQPPGWLLVALLCPAIRAVGQTSPSTSRRSYCLVSYATAHDRAASETRCFGDGPRTLAVRQGKARRSTAEHAEHAEEDAQNASRVAPFLRSPRAPRWIFLPCLVEPPAPPHRRGTGMHQCPNNHRKRATISTQNR